jgi:hypothetical protein
MNIVALSMSAKGTLATLCWHTLRRKREDHSVFPYVKLLIETKGPNTSADLRKEPWHWGLEG